LHDHSPLRQPEPCRHFPAAATDYLERASRLEGYATLRLRAIALRLLPILLILLILLCLWLGRGLGIRWGLPTLRNYWP
jgi:hypothetical protein